MSEISSLDQEEGEVPNHAPTLTLHDISAVVEIFRVITERGVWKPSELSTVGAVYDRLVNFLRSAGVNTDADTESLPQKEST